MEKRAGRRLRLAAREQRRQQRQRWDKRILGLFGAYVVLCVVLVGFVLLVSGAGLALFCAGVCIGLAPWLVDTALDSQEAQRLADAAIAEELTSNEVRRLRKQGWHVVDAVEFEKVDVDHVAVGPGGVVVLETKWTSMPLVAGSNAQSSRYLSQHLRQAVRNAQKVGGVLDQNGSEVGVGYRALVVWGPGRGGHEAPVLVEGTWVISGTALAQWLSDLPTVLCPDDVDGAVGAIAKFVDLRDTHTLTPHSRRRPLPFVGISPRRMATTAPAVDDPAHGFGRFAHEDHRAGARAMRGETSATNGTSGSAADRHL